jgi:sulfoacetaldehyde acetyltransferase
VVFLNLIFEIFYFENRNFVTGVAAAYWAHSPVVVITPETGSLSNGLGGFQETNQLPIFSEITKYQAHVCSPARMAELTDRCFNYAKLERGPVQVIHKKP